MRTTRTRAASVSIKAVELHSVSFSDSVVAVKALTLAMLATAAIASLPIAGAQARTRDCGVIRTTNHAGGSVRWGVTVVSGTVSCTTARRVLSYGLVLGANGHGRGNPKGWWCGPRATGAGLKCSRGSSVVVAR